MNSQIINLIKRKTIKPSFNNFGFLNNVRKFHSSSICKLDNPYKTLGVDSNASASEIKKAYYKLAKKYHPDINQEEGAEKRFHSLQEAYDILSDPKKKEQFDQFGSAAFDQNGGAGNSGHPYGGNPFAGGFGGFGGFSQNGGGNPFGDINFEDLFGGFGSQHGGRSRRSGGMQTFKGEDIEILKTISFKESIFGTKVKVIYSALTECNTCNGSGLKKNKKKSTCSSCNGTGSQIHTLQGGFQMAATCKSCDGTGVSIKHGDECNKCHGEGVDTEMKQTEIQLPSGLKDGSRIRVQQAGDAPHINKSNSYKLINGDLIIKVKVKNDLNFSRSGSNLIYKANIPMTTAALGGIIEVPTLDDITVRLKISAGTQNGRIIEIPDKGVPIGGNMNNRGSLNVIINIQTLTPVNATQTALLEAVADAFGDSTAKRMDPNWKPLEGIFNKDDNNKTQDSTKAAADACEHPNNVKRIETFLKDAFKKIMGDQNNNDKDKDKDKKD